MHDFGGVVKDPAKAMTTEVADNAVPEFFRMPLDRIADVAHGIPGLCLLDAQHHAFISHFNQTPRLDRRVTDAKHASGEIGRATVGTPVTNAPLVCRLLLETK